MELAGRYAYAGREVVVAEVLAILGTQADLEVHNHHNYAWREDVGGAPAWVVRKGATPAFPGQRGFVGATMGEPAVILEGVESRGGGRGAALDRPRRGPRDVAHEGGGQARHAAGVLRPRLHVLDDAQGGAAVPGAPATRG